MEFIKPGTNFDFVGKRKIAIGISIVLIIISILSIVMHKGLNFGIDFAGGTIIQVKQLPILFTELLSGEADLPSIVLITRLDEVLP